MVRAGSERQVILVHFLLETDSRAANLITRPLLRRAGMPFKFWKKEESKPAPPPSRKTESKAVEKAPETAPAKGGPKAPEKEAAPKRTPVDVAEEIHKGLVEAGLAMEGTREVVEKRPADRYASLDAFEKA